MDEKTNICSEIIVCSKLSHTEHRKQQLELSKIFFLTQETFFFINIVLVWKIYKAQFLHLSEYTLTGGCAR